MHKFSKPGQQADRRKLCSPPNLLDYFESVGIDRVYASSTGSAQLQTEAAVASHHIKIIERQQQQRAEVTRKGLTLRIGACATELHILWSVRGGRRWSSNAAGGQS